MPEEQTLQCFCEQSECGQLWEIYNAIITGGGGPDAPTFIESGGTIVNATIARPNDSAPYSINDLIGTATSSGAGFTFSAVVPTTGRPAIITSAELIIDLTSVPSGMGAFNLFLFNAAQTTNDNAAMNWSTAQLLTTGLGRIAFPTPVDYGSVLKSEAYQINNEILPTATSIYGSLVTTAAYTPAANTQYSVKLYIAYL